MLHELHIEDFALARLVDVEFAPGFNVLTGETGAGKSILIDAVQAAIGGRVSSTDIRRGSDRARIEASFLLEAAPIDPEIAESYGLDGEDVLILSREIPLEGRSKCRINGRLANASHLAEVGGRLVEVHGQHDARALAAVQRHIDLLDALGGEALLALRESVAKGVARRRSLRAEIDLLEQGERERARREDLLTYQIDEIAAARLEAGEDALLEAERGRLAHAERLAHGAREVYAALYEGDGNQPSALDMIGAAYERLLAISEYDPALGSFAAELESAMANLQEVARELRRYGEDVTYDPERLAEVEERLELINGLKRKYGEGIEEILAFAEAARAELDAVAGASERIKALKAELEALEASLGEQVQELSLLREETARRVSDMVERRLRYLQMPDAQFKVSIARRDDPDGIAVGGRRVALRSAGIDHVEFLFSANRGEEPQPLAKIASGGEMSRVMLAIKAALAEAERTPTLIFDEVDAGIGGETAQRVGDTLAELSRGRQVLVVTHLAQIAARADRHFVVEKTSTGDRTTVSVRPVEGEERVRELARMLDGKATEASFKHARALLELAAQGRAAI